jgi:hypothetical protein
MPQLDLPTVTLLCVETVMHEMARITLADMMSKVNFAEVVIHSDKPELIPIPGARYVTVPNWPEKIQCGRYCYNESPQSVNTPHMLFVEWDGCIRDVNAWEPGFLDYDYVGAPWPGRAAGQWDPKGLSVGNGGFTLWSRKLMDEVRRNSHWGIGTDVDIACKYRPSLEKQCSAKWAPEEVAYRFSFEHGTEQRRAQTSFGTHDIFNWPLSLDKPELERRARLLLQSEYVKKGTPKLYAMAQRAPWIRNAIPEYDNAMVEHRHIQRAAMTGNRQDFPRRLADIQHHALLQKKGIKA